jgi:hypothetical protein
MDYINILHEQSTEGLALNMKVGAVTTRFHMVNYTGNGVLRNLTYILARCSILSKHHTV